MRREILLITSSSVGTWSSSSSSVFTISLLVFISRFTIVITLPLSCDMTSTGITVTIFRWNITQNIIQLLLFRCSGGVIRWRTGITVVASEPYLVTIRTAPWNTTLVIRQVFPIFDALIASKSEQSLTKRRLFWQCLGQLYRLGLTFRSLCRDGKTIFLRFEFTNSALCPVRRTLNWVEHHKVSLILVWSTYEYFLLFSSFLNKEVLVKIVLSLKPL